MIAALYRSLTTSRGGREAAEVAPRHCRIKGRPKPGAESWYDCRPCAVLSDQFYGICLRNHSWLISTHYVLVQCWLPFVWSTSPLTHYVPAVQYRCSCSPIGYSNAVSVSPLFIAVNYSVYFCYFKRWQVFFTLLCPCLHALIGWMQPNPMNRSRLPIRYFNLS